MSRKGNRSLGRVREASAERPATGDGRRERRTRPHNTGDRDDEAQDAEQEHRDGVVVVSHTPCKPSDGRFGDILDQMRSLQAPQVRSS